MATTVPQTSPPSLRIGAAHIQLQNVQLREDVTLDEVHLDGETVVLEPPAADAPARLSTGETRVRAVLSEQNVNRMLAANPPDIPFRNLRASLLSGKVRFTGQAKLLGIPVALEGVPKVENGVRVFLDWQGVKFGLALPSSVVEVVEQYVNKTLDLTKSPVPVWIDEIRCEPGRLTVLGRARITWPPAPLSAPVPPFSARESAAAVPALPEESPLPPDREDVPALPEPAAEASPDSSEKPLLP
jgi:hypothetical protein